MTPSDFLSSETKNAISRTKQRYSDFEQTAIDGIVDLIVHRHKQLSDLPYESFRLTRLRSDFSGKTNAVVKNAANILWKITVQDSGRSAFFELGTKLPQIPSDVVIDQYPLIFPEVYFQNLQNGCNNADVNFNSEEFCSKIERQYGGFEKPITRIDTSDQSIQDFMRVFCHPYDGTLRLQREVAKPKTSARGYLRLQS